MYIKKEKQDEEEIVPKVSLDIKGFKTEETSEELLEQGYSDFSTLEPIKNPLKLKRSSRTSVQVGSKKLISKLKYFITVMQFFSLIFLSSSSVFFLILQLNSFIQ